MADTKISALTAGGTTQSTDLFPIARAGLNYSVTPLNIMAVASPTLTTPALGVATATSINKLTLTAPATGATLTLADGSTFATSGAFSTTLTVTGATTLTLPTSGTVTALGNTTTGSGSIVLATSPSLTTPTLGVASATSINKLTLTAPATGATLTLADGSTLATSGAFSTTFTATGTTTLTLPTSGTVTALGNTTTGSGSIVLATSPSLTTPTLGVASATTINKVTLTAPATGATLTLADGSTLATSGAFSTTFTATGTTTLTLPTSGTVTALGNTTTGSGNIVLATGPTLTTPALGVATSTSLAINGATIGSNSLAVTGPTTLTESVGSSALTLTGATQTTSQPVLNMTQTWNNVSTTFTSVLLNVTNSNSASASKLIDLQVAGSSQFSVNRIGSVSATNYTVGTSIQVQSATLALPSSGLLNWSVDGTYFGTTDAVIRKRASFNIQLGAADAATAVAQTLSVQSVVAGTTNTAGANFTINGSQGTGTGAGGDIIFQVAPAGTTGTAQNALATALRVYNNKTVFAGAGFTVAGLPAAGTAGRRAYVTDATAPTFLGALVGGGAVVTPVFDNGTAWVAG